MISVTGTTGKYILQPQLLEKHSEALRWLSASMLWKSEVIVFQKILDERAPLFDNTESKKKIDHFQNLIIYYKGEVIDALRKKIRDHEIRLAQMLELENESDTQYYREHQAIMDEASTFSKVFTEFRNDFLHFMETAKRP
jgi:hypothetical protein